jgi:hypothetical protein
MMLRWVSRNWALHLAEHPFGVRSTAHMAVECVGETGWQWHVWDASHRLRPHQGSVATLAEAKERAEHALVVMIQRIDRAA